MLERRKKKRFSICLDISSYKLIEKRRVRSSGSGKTLNISSTGILLQTLGLPFRVDNGMAIELSLEWPVHLGQVTPLQLLVWGRVVRSGNDGMIIAVQIEKYEFRTVRAVRRRFAGVG
jgi:c-di-GMP-binding flagellar brake protein YcgR